MQKTRKLQKPHRKKFVVNITCVLVKLKQICILENIVSSIPESEPYKPHTYSQTFRNFN